MSARDESRYYLSALQLIAEMIGLDTSREPAEGVMDVVYAVESFASGRGGISLTEAKARVSQHWLDQMRAAFEPTESAHQRGCKAYFLASGVDPESSR